MMNITEVPNDALNVSTCHMDCDAPLCDDLPIPLNTMASGHALGICGHSGSGKTTLMVSLLGAKKRKGKRQSFRKLFNNIVICSPSIHTISNNLFDGIGGGKKFRAFDDEAIDKVADLEEKEVEEGETNYTLLVLDDVSTALRKDAKLEKRLVQLFQNRRHMNVSIWCITQKYKDFPTGIRSNLSHFATFKPKTVPEMEAIYTEMMPFKKHHMLEFFDHVFSKKHSFLFIDMSLRELPGFVFYHNFNRLHITT